MDAGRARSPRPARKSLETDRLRGWLLFLRDELAMSGCPVCGIKANAHACPICLGVEKALNGEKAP